MLRTSIRRFVQSSSFGLLAGAARVRSVTLSGWPEANPPTPFRTRVPRLLLTLVCALPAAAQGPVLRPPAVPLIATDPYFSVWSAADRLAAGDTQHWTGTPQTLVGLARIDGRAYRLMGTGEEPPLEQKSVEVLPTRTVYGFEGGGVRLTLTFLTPLLPHDLDILARPVTYVTWEARSTDGREHRTALYFDASQELAVNTPEQPVLWSRFRLGGLDVLRMGSGEQPVLKKFGDNLRIDWGYLYLAAPAQPGASQTAAERSAARAEFVKTGKLPADDDLRIVAAPRRRNPQVLAWAFDLGAVGPQPVSRHLIAAYDDLFSFEYFYRRVRPWWRRKGAEAGDLLAWSERDYTSLNERCRRFDEELMADLHRAGGEEYARMCALAYRQAMAAHKLAADIDGSPLFFPKENFSNGCIDTVDVFYPSAPLFLLLNTRLLRGSVEPILRYASMERWPWPYAPHDLGTYPLANGQVYGGGEQSEDRQMPVEESGNMLLLVAAIARAEGNASLALQYWPLLTKWAEFLRDKGLDPENQLCTDDFAGHLARNANLSLKAIEGIGGYALLAGMAGKKEEAAKWRKTAEDYARRWLSLAADGDHFVLAFGQPGTWSQKYNLVWDRLLGLRLFPPEVARQEIAWYKTHQNAYGLPLDSRERYTKLDWIYWTATLADNDADFRALVLPTWKFANETPTRVPLTDWYWTHDAKQRGFQARSVVGGLFIKMLADPDLWKKWSQRAMGQ